MALDEMTPRMKPKAPAGNGSMCRLPSYEGRCLELPCILDSSMSSSDEIDPSSSSSSSSSSSNDIQPIDPHDEALKALSFFCPLMSLACLILVALIHYVAPQLRQHFVALQAQCLVAHSLAVISFTAANFTSLRGLPASLCRGIAAFGHFSFLTVFGWMHAMAWSIFLMLHRTKTKVAVGAGHHQRDSGAAWWRIVSFWLAPAIPVIVGLGTDPNFMGYGRDDACWMSWKSPGIVWLYLVPSGVALMGNALLFLGIVYTLIQIRSSQRMALPATTGLTVECMIRVVMRAGVVLGLEWVLGLALFLWPSVTILRYAFVIAVGSHGLWLFIALLTCSVRKKLKEKIKASFLSWLYS